MGVVRHQSWWQKKIEKKQGRPSKITGLFIKQETHGSPLINDLHSFSNKYSSDCDFRSSLSWAHRVAVIGAKFEISVPSSNFSWGRCDHFRTITLGKGRKQFFSPASAVGQYPALLGNHSPRRTYLNSKPAGCVGSASISLKNTLFGKPNSINDVVKTDAHILVMIARE